MPELPDVESMRRYLSRTSLKKKITGTSVTDESLLEDVSRRKLQRQLKNNKFTGTDRHGKYLFVNLGQGGSLILHFGMTGFIDYIKSDDDPPDHTRLVVEFDNNHKLTYSCQRKLGMIGLTPDKDKFVEDRNLGPDCRSRRFTKERFKELLENKSGSIKSALMDQNTMAGIGNVYSDEILFQTGHDPRINVNKLNDSDLDKIYNTMQRVLKVTTRHGADPDKFPRKYLTGHRDEGAKCPRCGGRIVKKTVSGRSAYFCRDHQRKK